jgi:protein translocase SecG subunit
MRQADIDGALVGGASLEAASFAQIVNLNNSEVYYCGLFFIYVIFSVVRRADCERSCSNQGKTDAGALFTSNISSTAFQPRGSQTILSKITIVAASIFMLSALLLAMPASDGKYLGVGNRRRNAVGIIAAA